MDWGYFTKRLIKLYKGKEVKGRLPFDPALVLKVEVIAHLYKLSESQVEVFVTENPPVKYFVGLAVDWKALDHYTLKIFQEQLLKNDTLHPHFTQEKGWSVNTMRMYPMYLRTDMVKEDHPMDHQPDWQHLVC